MRPSSLYLWTPACLMGAAAVFTVGLDLQQAMPLRQPLGSAVPGEIADHLGEDVTFSAADEQAAGATDYLFRIYTPIDSLEQDFFWVYVAYYDYQTQGKTIHSPKNCLPGAGWEPLASEYARVASAHGPVTVNRYLLQREGERVLVLYWYQGRGRVQANEYRVKFDLLRDAALRGRTEEALVRVVVPVIESEEYSFELGRTVAEALVRTVSQALPLW